MTLGEVATALADTAGLRKEDVMPMFLHPATTRTEEARRPRNAMHSVQFIQVLTAYILQKKRDSFSSIRLSFSSFCHFSSVK